MITIEHIRDEFMRQCPVYAENFAADNDSAIPMAAEASGDVKKIRARFEEECDLVVLIFSDSLERAVKKLYDALKTNSQNALVNAMSKVKTTTVLGTDRKILYGNWRLVESGPTIVKFICEINVEAF